MSQSVKRAARIIDAIAADPRTVAELAEAFELHRSTMFRELQSLEEVGWVRKLGSGRYTLGTRLAALSKESLESLDLREVGAEHVWRSALTTARGREMCEDLLPRQCNDRRCPHIC